MRETGNGAPQIDEVSAVLEGPWRQGSERRWLVRLADGRSAVLGQLLPELAQDEAVRRRYVRDAERLRDLRAAPLARILALGPGPDPRAPDAAPPWRLREEPEGQNLEALLARRAPLPIDEALFLAADLADAVHEVHRQGAVLRDLHPRHVLLSAPGRAALHRRRSRAGRRAVHADRREPGARGLALPRTRAASTARRSMPAPTSTPSASSPGERSPARCLLATSPRS